MKKGITPEARAYASNVWSETHHRRWIEVVSLLRDKIMETLDTNHGRTPEEDVEYEQWKSCVERKMRNHKKRMDVGLSLSTLPRLLCFFLTTIGAFQQRV